MRLVPRLLILLLTLPLAAQGRPNLPWEKVPPLPWQVEARRATAPAPEPPPASQGPLEVRVAPDGALQVRDPKGTLLLQAGLPGRPLRAWRDGGRPLAEASGVWTFPKDDPLAHGPGSFPLGAGDAREAFQGLLWVLEDGEAFLTVVNAATGGILHLPLPAGRDFRLAFHPDRLDLEAGQVERGAPRHWRLPWITLLPRLAALGPRPAPLKLGTALAPFPRD